MPTKPALDALEALSQKAAVPRYRREGLSAGILHFGVGNFHRAHQAVYLDDLFNRGADHDFAIVGAGVLPADAAGRDRLAGQDYLTTVIEQEAYRSQARVTGAMIDYLPPGDGAAIVARLADPAIRIVSLTITEGGYYVDPATGAFDPDHPDMRRDAAEPDRAKTVFGLILAGLRARRAAGLAPFTVMSCDNLPGNGHVTENAVAGLAELSDPGLADWVRREVAFPNGMVDRITPATGEREIAVCRDEFGIDDAWPVFCEDFRQWVLEDRFSAGRPRLEEAGVTFVDDVTAFELMKIRILNGGHAAIAYPAALMDIHFVHEAIENDLVRGFLEKLEREEIIPEVPPVPGTDIEAYFRLIGRRFANPKIGDTVARLCLDGSNRQPKFILPTAAERLKAGRPVDGLALVSAFWCRYCRGVSDNRRAIPPNDPNHERLKRAALAAEADPDVFLALGDIFGEVGRSAVFRDVFARHLATIRDHGTKETLRRYVAGEL